MIDPHKFVLFFAAAFVLAVTPGAGIFYVLARTLAGGRREGVQSSVGTFVGGQFHVLAAALGVSALRKSGWADAIAPGTELEIQVREPATSHRLTVGQIQRWCDGVAVSPDETLKKRRLKQLLA